MLDDKEKFLVRAIYKCISRKNVFLSLKLTHVNPLPDDKILDWSKLNQIADDF